MKNVASFLLIAGLASAGEISVVDEIICKANGDIVTRNDLLQDRKEAEAGFRKDGLTGARLRDAVDKAAKDFLSQRIDRLLLIQKGKELDIKVDSELKRQLAEYQRQSGIADPEKFQAYVRESTGRSYEDYKSDMQNNLMANRVIRQEVSSKIQPKSADLLQYYNEHKDQFQRQERIFLREILISTEGKDAAAAAAAERKAKDLSTRANKGEKFPEMAQLNSDNPVTAQDGGYMGAFEKGQLLPEIEAAVWERAKGYVTDPIKVKNGFEIFKVEEHQKAGLAEFEEVQNEVADELFRPLFTPKAREYMTKLRMNAFLEIKSGYEDSSAAPGKDTTWNEAAQLVPAQVSKQQVLDEKRRKKLLGVVPIPGTTSTKTGTSSSR